MTWRRATRPPASCPRRRRGSPTWRRAAARPRSPRRRADLADLHRHPRPHRPGSGSATRNCCARAPPAGRPSISSAPTCLRPRAGSGRARPNWTRCNRPPAGEYEIAAQRAMVEQARLAWPRRNGGWRSAACRGAGRRRWYRRHLCAPGRDHRRRAIRSSSCCRRKTFWCASSCPRPNFATLRMPATSSPSVATAVRPGLTASITFIAPQPEYTPPVIYSESNRDKLVYLIEAHPPPSRPCC